jgi:hypothetical protein
VLSHHQQAATAVIMRAFTPSRPENHTKQSFTYIGKAHNSAMTLAALSLEPMNPAEGKVWFRWFL